MHAIKPPLKALALKLEQNSPILLTSLGVAGVLGTAIMAVRATPKALLLLEIAREEREEELTTLDKIKVAWKPYLPAALLCVSTVTCVVCANRMQNRQVVALASAYSLADKALTEYQEHVIETIGANKELKLREEVAAKHIEKDPVTTKEVLITGVGEMLCYDSLSGRYFTSDIETLRKVQNILNARLINEMWVSLNELYGEIGLEGTKMGDDLGWTTDRLLEFLFASKLTNDGRPCLVLDFRVDPKFDPYGNH